MWDIKAISLYECRWKQIFHTNAKFKGTQSCTQHTHTAACRRTQACKTCHVTSTRIRVYLSVSSLKQDGWLANGNHGWNPTPSPCFLPLWESAPPFCLRPPLCRESHLPRVIPHFVLVSSFCTSHPPVKYKYIWETYLLYIYNTFNNF